MVSTLPKTSSLVGPWFFLLIALLGIASGLLNDDRRFIVAHHHLVADLVPRHRVDSIQLGHSALGQAERSLRLQHHRVGRGPEWHRLPLPLAAS